MSARLSYEASQRLAPGAPAGLDTALSAVGREAASLLAAPPNFVAAIAWSHSSCRPTHGHMGDPVTAEARATLEILARRGRPVRQFHVPCLDERALGALFMHFMLETILTARLMGVDAFSQPAVEESNVLTRSYLLGESA